MRLVQDRDEELRSAFALGSEQRAPEGDCPEPERIWDAARGVLAPEEARQVIDHTARCSACAEDFRLAAELVAAEAAESAPVPAPVVAKVVPIRRTWWQGLAAAAVLLLVVGLGWQLGPGFSPGPEAPPAYRAGEEAEIRSLLAPGQALPRTEATLRWQGPEGARYDLVVTTEDLAAVAAERDLDTPEYTLPAEALETVPDGAVLFWQVEAQLLDGSRLASPSFEARLGS